ncbi:MAG: UTP--glucose-1-phosphate uridylyltransferase [Deltaproteobacteria bacterium]|nr:UTP--glucose-1-phosphate uridylyltransferase [Deltaproteobacteria bacterium]
MKTMGIDVELTQNILDKCNTGKYDHFVPIVAKDFPKIQGKRIIDITGDVSVSMFASEAQHAIDRLGVVIDINSLGTLDGDQITFNNAALERIGILLYDVVAYGVLNGGSASSYVDKSKNVSFNESLFKICEAQFESMAKVSKGQPKGLTPAFINMDGSHGPSFLELKMRGVLIEALKSQMLNGMKSSKTLFPMYQMTSVHTNDQLAEAYRKYKFSEVLTDLMAETGLDITDMPSSIQPMLAALTHSCEGSPKRIFANAGGKPDTPLPMPGGHGQSFVVLKNIFWQLYSQGKRFVYIGNVDNLGATVNPVSIALMALKGKDAGFDFSFRTPVDVKGGVLVVDDNDRLHCADIGVAISKDDVLKKEAEGHRILFNCATGLFNLEFLVHNIDTIIDSLPMRISDQDKDAGKYSQAEQVTWEVIGILDKPLIFGVDKYARFLAAKLLLEGLMTSGIGLDHPDFPTDENEEKDLKRIANNLHNGLSRLLTDAYGMKKDGQRWVPKSVDELKADIIARYNI